MPNKKDNLPLNVDTDMDGNGSITYANEVIAIIAGVAANEVEGIAGMCASNGISDILGRNRNITRGVKVEIGSEETSVDLYVVVEYGTPIQTAAKDAQENVRKAIETMTGLHVVKVDVHVQGVSFEKENKALETGLQNAAIEGGFTLDEPADKKEEAQSAAQVESYKVELVEDEQVDAPEDQLEDEASMEDEEFEVEQPDTDEPAADEEAEEEDR